MENNEWTVLSGLLSDVKIVELKVLAGDEIYNVLNKAINLSEALQCQVSFIHNNRKVVVSHEPSK